MDAPSHRSLKVAVDRKCAELGLNKPEPRIFWVFIVAEKNRLLKDYEHGITQSFAVRGPDFEGRKTVVALYVGNAQGRGAGIDSRRQLESFLSSGPFEGQHEIAVAWHAYDWWTAYLDEIDRLANSA